MNDRQLRYAQAVWRERSFSRAAEKLGVSQPSLSDQVRLLEDEIGFEVFSRSSRGVEASATGRVFLDAAERVVFDFVELKELAQELRGKPGLRLRIGLSSGVAQHFIPRIVATLSKHAPGLHLEFATATTRRIQRLVHQQRLDLGVVFANPLAIGRYGLQAPVLRAARIVAVGTAKHRALQGGSHLTLAQLAAEPLIVAEMRLGYGQAALGALAAAGFTPNIAATSDDAESLKYIAAGGGGIALLPDLAVEDERGHALAVVAIEPAIELDIVMLRRPEQLAPRLEPSVALLTDALADVAPSSKVA